MSSSMCDYQTAAYLALGFLREPLTDEEVEGWGGELHAVAHVLTCMPIVKAAEKALLDESVDYPGVFLYEIVEELGWAIRGMEGMLPNDVKAAACRWVADEIDRTMAAVDDDPLKLYGKLMQSVHPGNASTSVS